MFVQGSASGSTVRKHKARENPNSGSSSQSSDSGSESPSSSGSDSESSSQSHFEVTTEYLESLLAKAKQNASAKRQGKAAAPSIPEEDTILLEKDPGQQELPPLDTGKLLPTYSALKGDQTIPQPDVKDDGTKSYYTPAPPVPPPELTKSGKNLTKKEKKALKKRTAGPDWFDLPAPADADLPRLYREVEALRLRNQLDPKRFYKKDEGEGKGIKGLPKYFAIGTVVPSSMSLVGSSGDNLTRAHRKRTLVDELVDDAEAKRYAKKKFTELQEIRGAGGRKRKLAHKRKR